MAGGIWNMRSLLLILVIPKKEENKKINKIIKKY